MVQPVRDQGQRRGGPTFEPEGKKGLSPGTSTLKRPEFPMAMPSKTIDETDIEGLEDDGKH